MAGRVMMAGDERTDLWRYRKTNYRPDRDYIDGELKERNLGELEHSNLQGAIITWLRRRQRDWEILAIPEQRVQLSETRFLVPDVCVIRREQAEAVITTPPLICIEVIARQDTMREMVERVGEYCDFGVPHVWLIDPYSGQAYVCTRDEMRLVQEGVLEIVGTPIHIPLAELFADLV